MKPKAKGAKRKTLNNPAKTQSNGTAQSIKEAATYLFARKGFKSTSVKDITDHANVNIGAINYHFQSKENLLQEIVKDYASINMESVIRTLKKSADSLAELKIILEIALSELLEISYQYKDLLKIIRNEIALMPDNGKQILEKAVVVILDIFKAFIESGQKKGLIKKDVDIVQVVLLIYSFVTTLGSDEILPLTKTYGEKDISDPGYREHAVSSITRILFLGIAEEKA